MASVLPDDCTVKYEHFRRVHATALCKIHDGPYEIVKNYKIDEHGGLTLAHIFRGEEEIATGEARCNVTDQYNRKLGRLIALGRALKQL